MNHDRRVRRVGDGWGFVVRVGGRGGKQYRRQGFRTAKTANAALRELLDQAGAGVPVGRRGQQTTVEGFLPQRWLPSLAGRDLRPTTVDSYRRITRNHLVPRLGGIKLAALDAATIETMLGELADAGLSPKTRRNVLGVLSKALADAVRWKLVSSNAAHESEWPSRPQAAVRAWTPEQLSAFLKHIAGTRDEALWRYFVISGARRGEVVGLRWGDVNLDAGLAVVANQRTLAAGHVVEGPPKTRSGARTITLDRETVAVLRRWRRAQRAEWCALVSARRSSTCSPDRPVSRNGRNGSRRIP